MLAVTNDEGGQACVPALGTYSFLGQECLGGQPPYQCAGRDRDRSSSVSARHWRRRRCLVLADGFYEWQTSRKRQKVHAGRTMKSGELFAFAGLWDSWRDPGGEIVKSCTIITTEPNELLRPIHNRMPVILPKELESFWLDDEVQDSIDPWRYFESLSCRSYGRL